MKNNGLKGMRWSFAGDIVAPAGQVAMEVLCLYAVLTSISVVAPDSSHRHPDFVFLAGLAITVAWLGRLTLLLPWSHYRTRALLIPMTGAMALAWYRLMLIPAKAWQPEMWVTILSAPERLDPSVTQIDFLSAWALKLTLWIRGLRIGLYPLDARELSHWLLGGLAVFVLLAGLADALPANRLGDLASKLGVLAFIYIGVGLAEVALVHIQTIHPDYGVRQPVSIAWLLGVILPVGLIFAVAIAVAYGLSPTLRILLEILVAIGRLIGTIIYWVLYVLLFVFAWLLSLLPKGSPPTFKPPRLLSPDFDWLLIWLCNFMIELFGAFCYLTISFNGEAILNLKNIGKSRRAPCGGWQIGF